MTIYIKGKSIETKSKLVIVAGVVGGCRRKE
jgi:hypothetical protein